MNRPLLWLALGLVPLLPGAASAGRCPFSMQSQVQVQIQWQRQQQQQSHLMAMQQRHAQQMAMQQRHAHNQRNTNFLAQRRNTTAMHRLTATHQQRRTITSTHRHTATVRIVRTTHHRNVTHTIHRTFGRHPGHGSGTHRIHRTVHLSTTRHTTALTRQLHRVTTQRRTTASTHRTTTTARRNASTVTRRATTTAQRRSNVTPRPRTTASNREQTRRTTQRTDQHRPTVQLRVRMTSTCGSCHQCNQNQPTVRQLPPRVPFVTAPRQPILDRPVVLNRPGPGPVVQQPRLPLRPVVNPPAQRTVVRLTMPAQVPVLRAPVLLPLQTINRPNLPQTKAEQPTISRPTPPTPSSDPLVPSTRKERPSDSESATKPRPSPLDKEPALPALAGSKAAIIPLLGSTTLAGDERPATQPAWRDDLDPAAVSSTPRLLPLAKAMPGRGILPNLDGEDADEAVTDAPAKDALAIKAPPLPPLPQSENQ
jgi:hypothetical protein